MRKIISIIIFAIPAIIVAQNDNSHGGGEYKFNPNNSPCLTEEKRIEIKQTLFANQQKLITQGKLAANRNTNTTVHPLFIWPVVKNPTAPYNNVWSISNHVDHDSNYPNFVLDWNCGDRTYDTSGGYNHKGIDIFTWPFTWYQFQNNQAWAVAAANGIILDKNNGNYDMNCAFNSSDWNAVYILHDDGSTSWYGHLKNGSLTTKNIGESVVAGEFLGVVGSSGSSTGPHLHFEVYNDNNQLIDTYAGPCNNWSSSTNTWWQNQKPYQDPKINAVLSHSAVPVFNSCPATETVNLNDNFSSGSTVYGIVYLADQLIGTTGNLTLIRPNGTTAATRTANFNVFYTASYWWWSFPASTFNQTGTWTFSFTYLGQTVTHSFNYGVLETDEFNNNTNSIFPNPVTNILNIESDKSFDKIIILDTTGKKILETTDTTINVENLAGGVYIIELYSGSNKYNEKFIKE